MRRQAEDVDLEPFRRELGEPVFQWLCACAVYPELDWRLTLHLGMLPDMPADLLGEDRLFALFGLPWFRNGVIPDDVRRALIDAIDPVVEARVRAALITLIEQHPAPPGSLAEQRQRLRLAAERLALHGSHTGNRLELLRLAREAPGYVLDSEPGVMAVLAKHVSRLDFRLPRRLRTILFQDGGVTASLRQSTRIIATLVVAGAAWFVVSPPAPPPASSNTEVEFAANPSSSGEAAPVQSAAPPAATEPAPDTDSPRSASPEPRTVPGATPGGNDGTPNSPSAQPPAPSTERVTLGDRFRAFPSAYGSWRNLDPADPLIEMDLAYLMEGMVRVTQRTRCATGVCTEMRAWQTGYTLGVEHGRDLVVRVDGALDLATRDAGAWKHTYFAALNGASDVVAIGDGSLWLGRWTSLPPAAALDDIRFERRQGQIVATAAGRCDPGQTGKEARCTWESVPVQLSSSSPGYASVVWRPEPGGASRPTLQTQFALMQDGRIRMITWSQPEVEGAPPARVFRDVLTRDVPAQSITLSLRDAANAAAAGRFDVDLLSTTTSDRFRVTVAADAKILNPSSTLQTYVLRVTSESFLPASRIVTFGSLNPSVSLPLITDPAKVTGIQLNDGRAFARVLQLVSRELSPNRRPEREPPDPLKTPEPLTTLLESRGGAVAHLLNVARLLEAITIERPLGMRTMASYLTTPLALQSRELASASVDPALLAILRSDPQFSKESTRYFSLRTPVELGIVFNLDAALDRGPVIAGFHIGNVDLSKLIPEVVAYTEPLMRGFDRTDPYLIHDLLMRAGLDPGYRLIVGGRRASP